jgi:hypothetical protein
MPTGACVTDIWKLVFIHIIKLYVQIVLFSCIYPVSIPGGEGKQATDSKTAAFMGRKLYFIQKNVKVNI